MDYKLIHDKLVKRGKRRGTRRESGYEMHHIIPKSLGGSNFKHNITKLTYREHFIIHKILLRLDPNEEAYLKAITVMERMFGKTSRKYASNKYIHGSSMSGNNNPIHNIPKEQRSKNVKEAMSRMSASDKLIMSENLSAAGKLRSKELSELMTKTNYKVYHDPAYADIRERKLKALLDPASMRRAHIATAKHIASLTPEERLKYGRKGLSKTKATCSHCGYEVTVNTLSRHKRSANCIHFEEIKESLLAKESQSSIARRLDIDERAVKKVKENLM